MACDLANYHFNPVKTGQIFKRFRLDLGMSITSVSKRSGLTYDTIDNIERGRVQDIKFEAMFKLCCVYCQPVEVVELLMLKDDSVDFMDQVLLYDNHQDESIPASNLESVPSSVPDTVIAAAEAVAATDISPAPVQKQAENPAHVAYLQQHIDHLTRLLEIAIAGKGGAS